jgi:hypothetical protein
LNKPSSKPLIDFELDAKSPTSSQEELQRIEEEEQKLKKRKRPLETFEYGDEPSSKHIPDTKLQHEIQKITAIDRLKD